MMKLFFSEYMGVVRLQIIRMGVSGRMFLLLPAYLGSPGQKAVKRLCVCVRACVRACVRVCVFVCR